MKQKNVLSLMVASLLSIAFVACSSGGGSGGGGNTPAKPGDKPAPIAGGNSPLTKNAWCSMTQGEQGQELLMHVTFQTDAQLIIKNFALKPDRSRGELVGEGKFPWTLVGDNLTITIDGKEEKLKMRLDPESQTGAPQLHIGPSAEQMQTFDPCS